MTNHKLSVTSSNKSRGPSPGALPSKTTMNLAFHESEFHVKQMIPMILFLIISAVLFTRFGLLDQLSEKTALLRDVGIREEALTAYQTRINELSKVNDDYSRYSYDLMTEEERAVVDRAAVLELLSRQLLAKSTVVNYDISGNTITADIRGVSLDEARTICKSLDEEEMVQSAMIYSAKTRETGQDADIFLSITVGKKAAEQLEGAAQEAALDTAGEEAGL